MEPEGYIDRFQIKTEYLRPSSSALALNLFNKGTELVNNGRYGEAISFLRKAIIADPNWEAPLINLTVAYRRLGRIGDALSTIRRALAINPNSPPAHNLKGIILMSAGKYRDALKEFEISHKLNPCDTASLMNMAIMYRRLGQSTTAIELYRKLAGLGVTDVASLHNLSLAYMSAGQTRDAIRAEVKALKNVPKQKRHYTYLANLFLRTGHGDWAKKLTLEEIRLFPNDPNPHPFLSQIYISDYFNKGDEILLIKAMTELRNYILKSGEHVLEARNMLFVLTLLRYTHSVKYVYKAIWELSSHFVDRGPDPTKNPVALFILHLLTMVIGGTIVVWLANLIGMRIAFNPNSVLFALFSSFAWNIALYVTTMLFSMLVLFILLSPFYVALCISRFRQRRLLFEFKSSITPTDHIHLRPPALHYEPKNTPPK